MKSPVVKRSIVIAGHKTSVSLEDAFWKGLKEIAGERDMTLSELVASIDSDRRHGNLTTRQVGVGDDSIHHVIDVHLHFESCRVYYNTVMLPSVVGGLGRGSDPKASVGVGDAVVVTDKARCRLHGVVGYVVAAVVVSTLALEGEPETTVPRCLVDVEPEIELVL